MKGDRTYTPAKLILLAELLALLIGLVTPITPSKTGATRGIPHLFFSEPGYLQEVAVFFVAVNLMMVVIGLVAAIAVRRERRLTRRTEQPPP